ncbi:MAG TPA: hypothetical protein VLF65_20065 [Burkholderiales bacterium]|nr:hypothetical protein [Burkholderiales bacterium]
MKRIVVPPPRPGLDMAAGYGWAQSTAIRAGDFVFASGIVAIDPESGERLNGTLASAFLAGWGWARRRVGDRTLLETWKSQTAALSGEPEPARDGGEIAVADTEPSSASLRAQLVHFRAVRAVVHHVRWIYLKGFRRPGLFRRGAVLR